ncbi:hypothetical protein HBHAL_4415 [Halobacillus halophilus DSM 2266]|uniref:Uncharacterized protein n=1 Tax=Halobacillus halophilus (strain ATCC 35676 / DSM 2266 / JCM 20832 / KCTC 3685 / LMG 17431 / NBRC 102448 / NCIMB 2269) TaxID=866895 RepID=I0JRI4_HALH3|nr:hypothetical protein HBHAL_4415 [Halobacillus halophilus DSM 2266]
MNPLYRNGLEHPTTSITKDFHGSVYAQNIQILFMKH